MRRRLGGFCRARTASSSRGTTPRHRAPAVLEAAHLLYLVPADQTGPDHRSMRRFAKEVAPTPPDAIAAKDGTPMEADAATTRRGLRASIASFHRTGYTTISFLFAKWGNPFDPGSSKSGPPRIYGWPLPPPWLPLPSSTGGYPMDVRGGKP